MFIIEADYLEWTPKTLAMPDKGRVECDESSEYGEEYTDAEKDLFSSYGTEPPGDSVPAERV